MSDESGVDRTTDYGFIWGLMEVTRVAEYRDVRLLSIETPERRRIEVWVSAPRGAASECSAGMEELA